MILDYLLNKLRGDLGYGKLESPKHTLKIGYGTTSYLPGAFVQFQAVG